MLRSLVGSEMCIRDRYGGTKFFNNYFSKSLRNLYSKNSKIEIISIQPGAVKTPMYLHAVDMLHGKKGSLMKKNMDKIGNKLEATPLEIAKYSFAALQFGKERDNGFWIHSIKFFILSFVKPVGIILRDILGDIRILRKQMK